METDNNDAVYIRHQVVDKLIHHGMMAPAREIIREADELVRYILEGLKNDNAGDPNASD